MYSIGVTCLEQHQQQWTHPKITSYSAHNASAFKTNSGKPLLREAPGCRRCARSRRLPNGGSSCSASQSSPSPNVSTPGRGGRGACHRCRCSSPPPTSGTDDDIGLPSVVLALAMRTAASNSSLGRAGWEPRSPCLASTVGNTPPGVDCQPCGNRTFTNHLREGFCSSGRLTHYRSCNGGTTLAPSPLTHFEGKSSGNLLGGWTLSGQPAWYSE